MPRLLATIRSIVVVSRPADLRHDAQRTAAIIGRILENCPTQIAYEWRTNALQMLFCLRAPSSWRVWKLGVRDSSGTEYSGTAKTSVSAPVSLICSAAAFKAFLLASFSSRAFFRSLACTAGAASTSAPVPNSTALLVDVPARSAVLIGRTCRAAGATRQAGILIDLQSSYA